MHEQLIHVQLSATSRACTPTSAYQARRGHIHIPFDQKSQLVHTSHTKCEVTAVEERNRSGKTITTYAR
jgi:hypothetical protein